MVNVNDVDSDDDGDAVAVRDAAEKAIAAAERVLMFEVSQAWNVWEVG